MHDHLAGIADDDELATAFDQMEPAAADFGDKGRASDFPLYIADSTTHDSASAGSLCTKDAGAPAWVCIGVTDRGGIDDLHAA